MKTRNKLLLSATAMLALSTGAMVTGTVAWFTTTRQVQVNFSNVTVMTTEGDLQVALVDNQTYGLTTSTGTSGELDIAGATTSTDISGDGIDFYKPSWNFDYSIALSMEDVTDLSTHAGYYTEFQLQLTRTNPTTTNGFLVYLGSQSAIEPLVDLDVEDEAAAASARVAVLNEAKDARKVLWTPENDSAYTYIEPGTAGVDDFYGLDAYKQTTYSGSDFLTVPFTNHTASTGSAHTGGNSPVIADMTETGGTPIDDVTVTVRIWIEGEDEEALNNAKQGQFSVTLDLYAMSL